MAPEHADAGIRDSHHEQCIHSHAGAADLLFRSALAACFSFAVGSPQAWLKAGSLRHTCGLDVQFAKNIHHCSSLRKDSILQF